MRFRYPRTSLLVCSASIRRSFSFRPFLQGILPATALAPWGLNAATSATSLLSNFNVITGDYNRNGETEGSVFVGGDFNPLNTHQIGFNSGAVPNSTDHALWLNNGPSAAAGSTLTNMQSGSVISRVSTRLRRGPVDLPGPIWSNPAIWKGLFL